MKVDLEPDTTFSHFRVQAAANFSTKYELAGRPIRDFASPDWFSRIENSSVWLRAYLIAGSTLLQPEHIALKADKLVAVFFRGSIRWVEAAKSRTTTDVSGNIDVAERHLGESTYLVLVAPFAVDGAPGDEARTRWHLDAMAGLLAAVTTPNVIYERIFDVIADLGVDRLTTHTGPIRNPAWYDAPITDTQPLSLFVKVIQELSTQPAVLRDRVQLSLRWYEAALREEDGPDAIIKHWVSLETLTMPETDIKPLVETLASAYGWSTDRVQQQFMIGRLFGLRSLIVHKGVRVSVHSNVRSFMAALYEDAVFATLGEPSQRRAERFLLARPSFDLGSCLRAAALGQQREEEKVLAKFSSTGPDNTGR